MAGSPEVKKNFLEDLKAARSFFLVIAGIYLAGASPYLGVVVAGVGLYLMHKDTQSTNY